MYTTGFAFSGNAERYVKFVAGQIRHWLVAGTFSAGALVLCLPVACHGTRPERALAVGFMVVAALLVALCFFFAAGRSGIIR